MNPDTCIKIRHVYVVNDELMMNACDDMTHIGYRSVLSLYSRLYCTIHRATGDKLARFRLLLFRKYLPSPDPVFRECERDNESDPHECQDNDNDHSLKTKIER